MPGGFANVFDTVQRRLDGDVEERDRLGSQRLTARDLGWIGRRRKRARASEAPCGVAVAPASRSAVAGYSSARALGTFADRWRQ